MGIDPRVRLAAVMAPAALVSITLEPPALALLSAVTLIMQFWARVHFIEWRRLLPMLIVSCVLILALHLTFAKSDEAMLVYGFTVPGAIRIGLLYCWRLVIFVGLALTFAKLVNAHEFAEIVWRILSPLRKLRVPIDTFGLALTLAVRFIPTIRQEYERIKLAQQLRGATSSGNIVARTRRYIPMFVPVFVSSLRRSETLGDALTVRGWGVAERRTFLNEWRFQGADWVLSVLFLALIISVWILSR